MKKSIYTVLIALILSACSTEKEEKSDAAIDPVLAAKSASLHEIDSLNTDLKIRMEANQRTEEVTTAMRLADAYQFYAIDFPKDSMSPKFLLRRGQLYQTMFQDPVRAAQFMEEVTNKYPDFKDNPTALLMSASAYHDAQDTANAIRMIDKLRYKYGTTPEAEEGQALAKYIRMSDEERLQFLNQ